jgi:hypothetical protein
MRTGVRPTTAFNNRAPGYASAAVRRHRHNAKPHRQQIYLANPQTHLSEWPVYVIIYVVFNSTVFGLSVIAVEFKFLRSCLSNDIEMRWLEIRNQAGSNLWPNFWMVTFHEIMTLFFFLFLFSRLCEVTGQQLQKRYTSVSMIF